MTAEELSKKLEGIIYDKKECWIDTAHTLAEANNLFVSFIDLNVEHRIVGVFNNKSETFQSHKYHIVNRTVYKYYEIVDAVHYVNEAFGFDASTPLMVDIVDAYLDLEVINNMPDGYEPPYWHAWRIITSFPSHKFKIKYYDDSESDGVVCSINDLSEFNVSRVKK